jgi:acylphosphatase
MPEHEIVGFQALVNGHVQGVGFRYFVHDTALSLGVKGWVRNRWNGDVEVLAEGERPALEKLLSSIRRGPRTSHVMGVQVDWQPATGDFNNFRIRRTTV